MADLFVDPDLRPASYYRPQRRSGGSAFGKFVLLGVILLGAGGGVTYFLLKRNVVIDNVVPVIQAEAEPIKERPTDPGGVAVLHQDTTAYDRLDKEAGRGKVEQLLPVAEKPNEQLIAANTPVKPPEPKAAMPEVEVKNALDNSDKPVVTPNTEVLAAQPDKSVTTVPEKASEDKALTKPADNKTEDKKPVADKKAEAAPVAEPKVVTATPEPKAVPTPVEAKPAKPIEQPFKTPEQMAAIKATKDAAKDKPGKEAAVATPVEGDKPLDVAQILAKTGVTAASPAETVAAEAAAEASPKTAAPEAKPVETPAVAMGGKMARVQLASSTDQEAAEKKMMDMVSQHADLLRSTRLTTVRADLGAKGIYYRIQTQSMAAPDAAKLCANLKAAHLECLIVKAP